MRLHRLEVEAFGPFAGSVEVDFDRLGADGLFLLHGHTGAGKTTVLDAVAFALYGTVPGARKDGKRLLSDHAPAGSVPTVTLEATIAGRHLRLVRSPEFERPKRRGSGTIKENAKATLTWLDGRGENLSRIPDIADEVGRLMGMSADQFFQVVLLPQGSSRSFCAPTTRNAVSSWRGCSTPPDSGRWRSGSSTAGAPALTTWTSINGPSTFCWHGSRRPRASREALMPIR